MKGVHLFEHLATSEARGAYPPPSGAFEFDLICLHGDRGPVEARAAALRHEDGSVVRFDVSRDVAARKRAEEAVGDNEINLRQLTETIPVMLWSATPEGAIDYCNARVLDYTGFDAEEVMGRGGFAKLLHPDDVDRTVQEWLSCIRTGAPFRVEVRKY